ncbi:MAG TPA: chromate transporter [Terrimicrobiaceae bacterium]|nr:chromate transporter [Terrimicrobiaceae bacterium]
MPDNPPTGRVSLFELALTFNHIALASFGGGLSAWSREVVVVEKKWMTEEEFLSALTMCRILPGANQVNLAVFVGNKMAGVPGTFAAVFGLTLVPVLIVLALGYGYFTYHHVPALQNILRGAAAAAVALTLSMAIKTGQKCLRGLVPLILFALIFGMNGVLRWHLLPCLAILAPISLAWGWPRKGEKKNEGGKTP